MKVHVRLKDLKNNQTVYKGQGEMELLESGSCIVEFGEVSEKSVWKILKKGILIENHGEVATRLFLPYQGEGKANITTPFGNLEMKITQIEMDATELITDLKVEDDALKITEEWIKVIHLSYLLNETEHFYFQMTLNMHK